MIQSWPSDCKRWGHAGYRLIPVDPSERSPVEDGVFDAFRRSGVAPTLLEAPIFCTPDQRETVHLFWERAVRHGTEAFLLPVRTGEDEFSIHTAMFLSKPEQFDFVASKLWTTTLKFVILENRLGPSRWVDLNKDSSATTGVGLVIDLPESGQWLPWRSDIYIREGFATSLGGEVTLRLGWEDDHDAIVDDAVISGTTPHRHIVKGSSMAGTVIANATYQTVPRQLQARIIKSGVLQAGDLTLVVRYRQK